MFDDIHLPLVHALGLKGAIREDVKRITGSDKRDLIPHRSMESVFVNADSSRLYLLEIIADGSVSLTRYLPRFEPIDPTDFERDFIEPLGGLGIGQLFYVQRADGISETIEALWDSVSGEWFITRGREPASSYAQTLNRLKALAIKLDMVALRSFMNSLPEDLLWKVYAEEVYDWVMDISFARDLTEAHIEKASRHLMETGGGPVLDIGAGTGLVARGLVDRGFDLVAVEPNPFMAERLRGRLTGFPSVRIHEGFFENVNLGDTPFDVITLRNVLYVIQEPEVFMRKVFSHLKPGGKVLVSGPMPNGRDITPLLARDTLRELNRTGREEEAWRFALIGLLNQRLFKESYTRPATEVAEMLRGVGFEVDDGDVDSKFYHGSTYLVTATKPVLGESFDRVQVVGEEGGTLHPEEDALDILEADNSGDILEGAADPEEVEDEMPEEKEVPPTLGTSPFPGQLTGVKTGILERAFQTKAGVSLALFK